MNTPDPECAWSGCCRQATCARDPETPLCERHDAIADRLHILEVGFMIGLGAGVISEFFDSD